MAKSKKNRIQWKRVHNVSRETIVSMLETDETANGVQPKTPSTKHQTKDGKVTKKG